jgi:ATP-dependent DNA helicase RecQ
MYKLNNLFKTKKYIPEIVEVLNQLLLIENFSESEIWKISHLTRTLKAFYNSREISDRAILLREIVRINDNYLRVAKVIFPFDERELENLKRFGLIYKPIDDENEMVIFSIDKENYPIEEIKIELQAVLELDSNLRRVISFDTPDGALRRLKAYTSYQTPTQKSAIRSLLTMPSGGTLMLTMPTGSGKSLLFQMGSLWWRELDNDEKPVSVVIVPTISLALDHLETMKTISGLENSQAVFGKMDDSKKDEIISGFREGKVPLLFISPEAVLNSGSFAEVLRSTAQKREDRLAEALGKLEAIFIDEAHIIHYWGRSFRPDFQRLGAFIKELKQINPNLKTILLSATINDSTASILEDQFGSSTNFQKISAGVPRTEFDWVKFKFENIEVRNRKVLEIVDWLPRPGIIYTTEKSSAEFLYNELKENSRYARIELFTGDTKDEKREKIIKDWREENLDLVIATSAFGMGINKANVRFVLHACLPEDALRFYQEVGRGGRDGHQCLSLCLWCEEDKDTARSLALGSPIGEEKANLRWKAILDDAFENNRVNQVKGIIEVNLNSKHELLGREAGEKNRRWNRVLLNLLQRSPSKPLEVLTVNQDRYFWTVRINDNRLLNKSNPEFDSVFQELLGFREKEIKNAIGDFNKFLEIINKDTDDLNFCFLSSLYSLIDSDLHELVPCGRCAICKGYGDDPLIQLNFKGKNIIWENPNTSLSCKLKFQQLLIHSDSQIESILKSTINNLAKLNIIQYILPKAYCSEVAEELSQYNKNPGLILELEQLLEQDWAYAKVPSVIIIEEKTLTNDYLLKLINNFKEWDLPLVILTNPFLKVDGRYLTQLIYSPPYSVEFLDKLVKENNL